MTIDLRGGKKGFIGPTFTLKNRVLRTLWIFVWLVFGRFTPPMAHRWRIMLLNLFGGKVSKRAYVYPSCKVWAPWNLTMAEYATLGPNTECYNIGLVSLGRKAVVSQWAKIYTGTHDYRQDAFALFAQPIKIGAHSWIAAGAFVGPGVVIGEGAILGAQAVTFQDLAPWSIHIGNPAGFVKDRPRLG